MEGRDVMGQIEYLNKHPLPTFASKWYAKMGVVTVQRRWFRSLQYKKVA